MSGKKKGRYFMLHLCVTDRTQRLVGLVHGLGGCEERLQKYFWLQFTVIYNPMILTRFSWQALASVPSFNFPSTHSFPGLYILINSRVWWPFFVTHGDWLPQPALCNSFLWIFLLLKWGRSSFSMYGSPWDESPEPRTDNSTRNRCGRGHLMSIPSSKEKLCRLQTWCWEMGTLLIKMSVTQIPLRWERAAFFITIAVNDTVGWYLAEA